MIFSISGNLGKAERFDAQTFIGLDIWERQHIEEWIRENPEMLGEELLVLSTEFDRFVNSKDRLDVLALDRDANLVVIELKRDPASGYADLQALRYAAMVSSMTIEKVLPYFVSYRQKHHAESLNLAEARKRIAEFVDDDSLTEISRRPRIILCSEGFSPEITTTVLWLRDSKVDVSCVTITPYKVQDRVIIVPRMIIPLPEAKQYLIEIKNKEMKEEQIEQSEKKSRRRTMSLLLEAGLVKAGERIFLKNALPSYLHFIEGDPTFEAVITGKTGRSDAVRWEKDGKEYSISNLTWIIFNEFHPQANYTGGVNGNWHWVNAEGHSLWTIAEESLGQEGD